MSRWLGFGRRVVDDLERTVGGVDGSRLTCWRGNGIGIVGTWTWRWFKLLSYGARGAGVGWESKTLIDVYSERRVERQYAGRRGSLRGSRSKVDLRACGRRGRGRR